MPGRAVTALCEETSAINSKRLRELIMAAHGTVGRYHRKMSRHTWKGPFKDKDFDRTIVDVARTMNRLNAAVLDVKIFLPADEHERVLAG